MESHASSTDDTLVDGLSYKLKNGAKYITDRRSVTFFPAGSNIYATTAGTKVLKFVLTGEQWLIPDSVRVMFTLRNKDANVAHELRPLSGPWAFWRRMRILCGGQVVEDFDYNRTAEMYHNLRSPEAKASERMEGFHTNADALEPNVPRPTTGSLRGIVGGQSQRVSFKLHSGLLSQPKWLPIR